MENKDLQVDEVKLNTWNPNEMQPEKIDHLSTIISTLGFLQNIVVWQKPDGSFVCLDGEHRLKALDIAEIEKVEAKILTTTDLFKIALKMREQGLLSFKPEPTKEEAIAEMVAEFITVLMNKIRGRENPEKVSLIYARAMEKRVQEAELLQIFNMKEQELQAYLILARERDKNKEDAVNIIKGQTKPEIHEIKLMLNDKDFTTIKRALGHTSQGDVTDGILQIVEEYCETHNIPTGDEQQ